MSAEYRVPSAELLPNGMTWAEATAAVERITAAWKPMRAAVQAVFEVLVDFASRPEVQEWLAAEERLKGQPR